MIAFHHHPKRRPKLFWRLLVDYIEKFLRLSIFVVVRGRQAGTRGSTLHSITGLFLVMLPAEYRHSAFFLVLSGTRCSISRLACGRSLSPCAIRCIGIGDTEGLQCYSQNDRSLASCSAVRLPRWPT